MAEAACPGMWISLEQFWGSGEVACSRPRTGQARQGLGTEFCLLIILLFAVEKFQTHPKAVGNANGHPSYTYYLASMIITIVNVI